MRDRVGSLGIDLHSVQGMEALRDLCILGCFETRSSSQGVSRPEFKCWSMCLVLLNPRSMFPDTSFLQGRGPALHVKRLEGPLKHLPQIPAFSYSAEIPTSGYMSLPAEPHPSKRLRLSHRGLELSMSTSKFSSSQPANMFFLLRALFTLPGRPRILSLPHLLHLIGHKSCGFHYFSERIYPFLPICSRIYLSGVLVIFHPGFAIVF